MVSRAIIENGEEKEAEDRKKGKATDEGKMNQGLDQAEGGEERD